MGYQIESYDIGELNRIALPGRVAPSLFWALPVGPWGSALQDAWYWFTQNPSTCQKYGLLLVKNLSPDVHAVSNVDMAAVEARLSDLIPAGARQFVDPLVLNTSSPKILVFSGAYPQPGWGVLIDWPGHIRAFDDLIARTISALTAEVDRSEEFRSFEQATTDFHQLRGIGPPPVEAEDTELDKTLRGAGRVESLLRDAETALLAGNFRELGEKLSSAREVGKHVLPNIDAEISRLVQSQQQLVTATSISSVSVETLELRILPRLKQLRENPQVQGNVYRTLPTPAHKDALRSWHSLAGDEGLQPALRVWEKASKAAMNLPNSIASGIQSLRNTIEDELVVPNGQKDKRNRAHTRNLTRWRRESSTAREAFHRSAQLAAQAQWTLGADFLFTLESICRKDQRPALSIPWDPPRMVGWKLRCAKLSLDVRDLHDATKNLLGPSTAFTPRNQIGIADGSLFTDYVHYVAMSKPGVSPWTATRELLTEWARSAELRDTLLALNHTAQENAPKAKLVEALLDAFGWRRSDGARDRPLAWFINGLKDGQGLQGQPSGNDLRISMESFCKDLLRVIVSHLGYEHSIIWAAIEERDPDFRPNGPSKDWDREIRMLTVGSAARLLKALAPLAFPDFPSDISKLVSDLSKLAAKVNSASHHDGSTSSGSTPLEEAGPLVALILDSTHAFLGELPWHLDDGTVYGEQPKVLTGEAWSHGSVLPRMLRVLVWNGDVNGSRVTFWNKTGTNPIVSDPVFIS